MRNALALAASLTVLAAPAWAETPAELVAQGQELATAGEYSRAIVKFKEADRAQPSAEHACLIGLAYTRREEWSLAEIYFDLCKRRSRAGDALPAWTDDATQLLATKLSAPELSLAPIEIRVEPALPGTTVRVSNFPADETFVPQTIHLGPGTYELIASAPGRSDARTKVTVASGTAQIVTLTLPAPPPIVPPRTGMRTGTKIWLAGGGVLVAGIALHALAARERGELVTAYDEGDPDRYDDHRGRFVALRGAALGCYGAALVAGVVGYLVRRGEVADESAPVVGASVDGAQALVTLRWRR